MRIELLRKVSVLIIAALLAGCHKRQVPIFDELIVPMKGVPGVLEFGMMISEVEDRFDIVQTHKFWYLIPELGVSVETLEDGSIFRMVFYLEPETAKFGEECMGKRRWKISEYSGLRAPYRMRDVEQQIGKVFDIDRMCYSPSVYFELLERGEMSFHEKVWSDDDSRFLITYSHKRLRFSNCDKDYDPEFVGVIVATEELRKSSHDWLIVGAEQKIEPHQGTGRITVDCPNDEHVLVLPVANFTGCDIRFKIEFDTTLRGVVAGAQYLRAGRSSILIFSPVKQGRLRIDYSSVSMSTNAFTDCKLVCKVIPDE